MNDLAFEQGTTLHAVRDAKGHFKDIQAHQCAAGMDMGRQFESDIAAACGNATKAQAGR